MRATRFTTGAGRNLRRPTMKAIDTKAMKGIKSYLERRGFEILEES
ncbi:hypothetical protein [Olsenella uli]